MAEKTHRPFLAFLLCATVAVAAWVAVVTIYLGRFDGGWPVGVARHPLWASTAYIPALGGAYGAMLLKQHARLISRCVARARAWLRLALTVARTHSNLTTNEAINYRKYHYLKDEVCRIAAARLS